MDGFYYWWLMGSLLANVASGTLLWWTQRRYEQALIALVPVGQRLEPWVVDRPDEVDRIVRALRGRGASVGITTAVHGAGGFGKTTVARMVRADKRVMRRFAGRVYWVTLGRDIRHGALVEKVNDLMRQIDPLRAQQFTDVRQAAERLAALLAAGPRRLVIVDDVWFEDQLKAFPVAGGCARLVTTRVSSLIQDSVPVKVDQMSVAQARTLLTVGVSELPDAVVDGLLVETGRWPLLLRLVNKILLDRAQLHINAAEMAEDLLRTLSRGGVLQVDSLNSAATVELDLDDPDQRDDAVAMTIEASTSLLGESERTRFAELAVFAEDEVVPVGLVGALWSATSGLDFVHVQALCMRLADLALLDVMPTASGGGVALHDVVRDFLRREVGDERLMQLHRVLLDMVAASVPKVLSPPFGVDVEEVAAWWSLSDSDRYMWDHVVEHLIDAGVSGDAELLVSDLRWVGARVEYFGATAAIADLARLDTVRTERLRRLLVQSAHLLSRTEPTHSRIDVLYSRVSHDPEWGPQSRSLSDERLQPRLVNEWPLPDLPDASHIRTLAGHLGSVYVIAVAPDGRWMASSGYDRTIRVWAVETGQPRAALTGHTSAVLALAISPDAKWIATGGNDRTIRIWDVENGQTRTLTRRTGSVRAIAISPDAKWIASGGNDRTVRIWDTETGQPRAALIGHTGWVHALAISPDGRWIASGGNDPTVRLWDAETGEPRASLTSDTRSIHTIAISPDGKWLAAGGEERALRIWDVETGQSHALDTGHTSSIHTIAISPEGRWLAAGREDRTVQIWDVATGRLRATLTGHTGSIHTVAVSPNGTWLVSGGEDRMLRVSDTKVSAPPATRMGHTGWVRAVAVSADGKWFATGGEDRTVQIWDSETGEPRATLNGHTGTVRAAVVSPDSTWLATAGEDGTVRISTEFGGLHAVLTGHIGTIRAVAVSPDGTWLATGGNDQRVRLWDATTGPPRAVLSGHSGTIHTVLISPDGKWLATGGEDRSLRIWDAEAGQVRALLTSDTGWIQTVAMSPDGKWLATASNDRTVRIWDAEAGRQSAVLTGHTDSVHTMVVSPDGRWMATASNDRTVRIWDAETSHLRATLTSAIGSVRTMAISADSKWLVTSGNDRTVRIWNSAVNEVVAMTRLERRVIACAWNLTAPTLVLIGPMAELYKLTVRI